MSRFDQTPVQVAISCLEHRLLTLCSRREDMLAEFGPLSGDEDLDVLLAKKEGNVDDEIARTRAALRYFRSQK